MDSVLYGYCHCGCGGKTNLVERNYLGDGLLKGEPRKYIRGHSTKQPPQYKICENSGCWLWQRGFTSKGYGSIFYQGRKIGAHVFYYENKYGPVPNGLELDHFYCNNRACCNPDHVQPVTRAENVRRGNSTKLSIDTIHIIRSLKDTLTYREIAKRYSISSPHVSNIINNKVWRDI